MKFSPYQALRGPIPWHTYQLRVASTHKSCGGLNNLMSTSWIRFWDGRGIRCSWNGWELTVLTTAEFTRIALFTIMWYNFDILYWNRIRPTAYWIQHIPHIQLQFNNNPRIFLIYFHLVYLYLVHLNYYLIFTLQLIELEWFTNSLVSKIFIELHNITSAY